MSTTIIVTRKLQIQSLIDIGSADFKHWYELGTWWALYGDGKGIGPYDDQYLIGTSPVTLSPVGTTILPQPTFQEWAFILA